MTTQLTISAISGMFYEKSRFSDSSKIVSIFHDPKDSEKIHFAVENLSVFSIAFGEKQALFSWNGLNCEGLSLDAKKAAVDALDFMFETTGVSASAEIINFGIHVCGRDLRNGLLPSFPFNASSFQNVLNDDIASPSMKNEQKYQNQDSSSKRRKMQ